MSPGSTLCPGCPHLSLVLQQLELTCPGLAQTQMCSNSVTKCPALLVEPAHLGPLPKLASSKSQAPYNEYPL